STNNSGEPIQPKTDELNAKDAISPELDSLSKETLTIDKKPLKRLHGVTNRVPRIPAKAIKRKGAKLNRFYFVRKGDSPKKVASLIYGSPKQASKLIQWNGKNWTPGKIIYYASVQKPKDPKMDSFYKENGVAAEEYSVGSGEWLSKIAMKKLGSPKSWTEIAIINGIKKPKALEVGQKIAIYPIDLSRTEEPALAQNETLQKTPAVEAKPIQPPPVVEPPTQRVAEEPPTPIAPAKEPVKAAPTGFDAQKFIEQNAFAGLMGLAGFFLILLLIVKKRNKSRANSQDDFLEGEEGFQPPTKLKRK
ncbi:MAG: LysM peptidoglycan-binding domain-containing protein, partial [Deltaproteobacteria bacterium]